jgi:hypothetical protein
VSDDLTEQKQTGESGHRRDLAKSGRAGSGER